MTCSGCKTEKTVKTTKQAETERLPKDWKRHEEEAFCKLCWQQRYVLRAITMQVVGPLTSTWAEYRAALGEMWKLTTQASNWLLTELYSADVRRTPDSDPKMPPMRFTYLYPEARKVFPGLPSNTVAYLEHTTKAKYEKLRYDTLWQRSCSLPTVRYACPFPVPSQVWSVSFDSGNRPVVSSLIGDKRWEFRLAGGPRYRRQPASLRQIENGSAVQCDMSLIRRFDASAKRITIMCKMVAWLPRKPKGNLDGTLFVRSTPDSLLIACDGKGELVWGPYNADHVRRWSAEHERFYMRLAEDQKAEQRPVPSFGKKRTAAVIKYRDRMTSAINEITASVVNFAVRRKYARIEFDDSDHRFCEMFRWFDFRTVLSRKADGAGIDFVHVNADMENESHEPFAERI